MMLKPGDIVTVDFPGVTGVKRRPAVVVSTSEYQMHRPDVILGIITSQVADATTPLDYVLHDWAAASLRRSSAFRAFLVTVPVADVRAIGRCSVRDWAEIQARLTLAVAVK